MEGTLFKDVVCTEDCPPLVFKHAIEEWPALKWTPESLGTLLHKKVLQCKISPVDVEGVQWETESLHLMVTIQQYSDWISGQADLENPLKKFDPEKFSCYIDYKYMKDMFSENSSFLKDEDWGVFGLEGRDGRDSTIWMGSAGAYTPCHYDTYGFNLVAQLCGRKRWYLFSPKQTRHMYATRIPYEESSVFSEVNIRWPDLRKHRLYKDVEVYIVDLHPGEVLYVPRHWWHFVECLDSSISVNTWIPVKEDITSHYHEAVSRLLFTAIHGVMPNDQMTEDYININEELQPSSVNLSYLNRALTQVRAQCSRAEAGDRPLCGQNQEESSQKMCRPEYCKSEQLGTKQCERGHSVKKECKCDSVDEHNFGKFCTAFPGHCVTCTSNDYGMATSSHNKRKCGDAVNTGENVPNKIHKLVERERGLSVDDKNVTLTQPCNDSVSDGTCVTKGEKDKTRIFLCNRYSFQQYMLFLREKYEYDEDESDYAQSEEASELSGTGGHDNGVTLKDVMNSLLQPEIVQHIAQTLQNRVVTRP